MATTLTELEDFHHFAEQRLRNGFGESLEELFDLWLIEHPTVEECADVHEAIRQGLADVAAARYRPASEVTAELVAKHGIAKQ